MLKRAYMLKEILENMTLYIEDETVTVGNQKASSNKDAYFPRVYFKFVLNRLDLLEADGTFYITEETEQHRSLSGRKQPPASERGSTSEEVQVYMELASLAWKER